MADQQHFTCIIRPTRPGFVENPTPEEDQIMSDHFQYLKRGLEAGIVLMAGPCLAGDDSFGIIVLRAESREAAQAFIDRDTSVANGVQQATLYPFRLSLWAGK
jgi:uncharacterized protein YciI